MILPGYELWGAAARPVLGNPEVEAYRAFALSSPLAGEARRSRLFVRVSSGSAVEAASLFDSLGFESLLISREIPGGAASSNSAALPVFQPGSPRSLALVGPMASGKSTVGPRLAELFGLSFVDSDSAIEAEAGRSVAAIFASEGEEGFRRRESAVLAGLLGRGGFVIATGGGAVLLRENRELLRAGALVVWLHASPEALESRLEPGTRPLLEGGDALGKLASIYRERRLLYAEVADFLMPTEGKNPQEIAEVIHEEILRAR